MVHYPRLIINLSSIRHNASLIYNLLKGYNISTIAVTKGTLSDPHIVDTISSVGIKYIGDSRILNIKKVREHFPHLTTVLLRIPMLSEVDDVVYLADISLNSEPLVIKALGNAAHARGIVHKVILMVDVGDRREGILPGDLLDVVREIRGIKGIKIAGIGANFACFGGVLPDEKNLTLLAGLAKDVSSIIQEELEFVSGGSTSSLYLIKNGTMPEGITNLRIGTGILFGIDDIRDIGIEGAYTDTFMLEAEIVEIKNKPSLPVGTIAKDAFGNIPHFKDRGIRKRAILGIGRQDVIFEALHPVDEEIEIVGGSSDHMIVDVTSSYTNYGIGDIIRFNLDYPAMLYLFNSSYVVKIWGKEVDR